MAMWSTIETAAPELAARVQARFASHRHALLATLRADGSPRLSGIETQFVLDELFMGMMRDSRKAHDLQRDGRFALHSAPDVAEIPAGDATIRGTAVEVTDPATIGKWAATLGQGPPGEFHLFRCDVREVGILAAAPEGDHLDIDFWREGQGLRHVDRY